MSCGSGSKKLFVGKALKKAERQELLKHEKEVVNCNIGKQNASNLYVKNLDASVDDNILQEYFSSCGQITSAKVMRHDSGISKGFGFVCFSTSEEAKKALAILNGKSSLLFPLLYACLKVFDSILV